MEKKGAKIPLEPLEKIAMSCSGGGYRATGFHLGSMLYLDRLQYRGKSLLDRVEMISTVSGGTITGVVYALQKQQDRPFNTIYYFLTQQLQDLDLVKLGLQKLNPDAMWNSTHKRKNLINAFAELYDEYLTGGATLADLEVMKPGLKNVVFNSTEFKDAINFRFRNAGRSYTGNNSNRVTADAAKQIKLSDIIASSSCFPGGFEPMVWPADFAHANAGVLQSMIDQKAPLGLMDGGIYDNQGIESILLYKKADHPFFELIIISDVTSPFMTAFEPARESAKKGILTWTLKKLRNRAKWFNIAFNLLMLGLVALFALLPMKDQYASTFKNGVFMGLSGGLLLLLLFKISLFSGVKKIVTSTVKKLIPPIPAYFLERLGVLNVDALSVHRAEPLLKDRINSLISLLMDVFLKVVRRLNYDKVYEDDRLQYRRISNLIQELTEADYTSKNKVTDPADVSAEETGHASVGLLSPLKGRYLDIVGTKISEIVKEAASFGTTLWFAQDEPLQNMIRKLVVTGQVTMCFNMYEYLFKVINGADNGFAELPKDVRDELTSLYTQCRNDWEHFKNDPCFIWDEMELKRPKEKIRLK